MKAKQIIWAVFFIFLGVTVLNSAAEARRRPSVSSGTEEETPTVQEQEVKETVQPQSSEELSGSELEQYLQENKGNKSLLEEDAPVVEEEKVKAPVKKQAEETTDEDTGFSAWTPGNAMLRSLMLPGWGQFFNEQYTKGYVIAGTELVLLSTALVFYTQANSTYSDYENGSASYDDYTKKIDTTNMVVGVFAAVWIYNVIDAYINAFGPDEGSLLRKDGFTVAVNNNQGFSVLYTRKF